MSFSKLKKGTWVYTKRGYGAVRGVRATGAPLALVTIFAPEILGAVRMTPGDIVRELHAQELAQFHHRVPDTQVIGATTIYTGDEFVQDRGDRFRIVGVYRNALLADVDVDKPGYLVTDNERLTELGGVTKNDRIDALYVGKGNSGFVHTDPRAVDLALFAHLRS